LLTTTEETLKTDDRDHACTPCNGSARSIRELNDALRQTLAGGKCVITAGVAALGRATVIRLVDRVRGHSEFTSDNDPYGEHDFGAFEHGGTRFFWKIDCFDRSLTFGSEDPADPDRTIRVLTLMKAEEY
jgi:Protein of unknown function (DUF3768)